MQKFRKIAVVVEAVRWFKNGDHPLDFVYPRTVLEKDELVTKPGSWFKENDWEGQLVRYFRHPGIPGEKICEYCHKTMNEHGFIDGNYNGGAQCTVCPGDWVVTGVNGEIYPCKPEIFAKTFEAIQ